MQNKTFSNIEKNSGKENYVIPANYISDMKNVLYEINKLRGHIRNRELLRKLVKQNCASGSYIFSGMSSVGKKKVALWFAQLVNCREQNAPCGICISCRKIENGVHPDVKLISRLEGKTAITIEQVREQLVSEANFKPLEGRFRVFIIDDAHFLNDQAQNALLKVMEEPGGTIIIILVTSRPADLIETIISRCRNLRFYPLSSEDIEFILSDISGINLERIHLAVATSAGSPGKAIRQATDVDFWKMRTAIFSILEKLPDGSLGDILKFCETFDVVRTEPEQLESVFEIILSWFRDIIYIQNGASNNMLINTDFKDSLEKVAYCYSDEDVVSMQDLILEIRKLVFENNLNIRMGLQRLLIRAKQYGSVRI